MIITDVVVVRDDNFAAGPSAFTALREPPAPAGDGMPGVRVATGVSVFFGGPLLGNQRVGSRIAIAVDPNNSQRVYLAWGDGARCRQLRDSTCENPSMAARPGAAICAGFPRRQTRALPSTAEGGWAFFTRG